MIAGRLQHIVFAIVFEAVPFAAKTPHLGQRGRAPRRRGSDGSSKRRIRPDSKGEDTSCGFAQAATTAARLHPSGGGSLYMERLAGRWRRTSGSGPARPAKRGIRALAKPPRHPPNLPANSGPYRSDDVPNAEPSFLSGRSSFVPIPTRFVPAPKAGGFF